MLSQSDEIAYESSGFVLGCQVEWSDSSWFVFAARRRQSFNIMCSYGNQYELTQNRESKDDQLLKYGCLSAKTATSPTCRQAHSLAAMAMFVPQRALPYEIHVHPGPRD